MLTLFKLFPIIIMIIFLTIGVLLCLLINKIFRKK